MSDIIWSDYHSAAVTTPSKKKMSYWQKGSTSTAMPSISAAYVAGQFNKIGDVTSGATFAKNVMLTSYERIQK